MTTVLSSPTLTAADKAKLAWSKPVVRELFRFEARKWRTGKTLPHVNT